MSARSSNSSDSPDAGKPRSSVDPEPDSAADESLPADDSKSLETFEFEASAGRSTKSSDKDRSSLNAPTPPPPRPTSQHAAETPARFVPSETSYPPPDGPADELADEPADELADEPAAGPIGALTDGSTRPDPSALPEQLEVAEKTPNPVAERPARPAGKVSRQSSWWITSLGVHVLLLLALAFSTLAVIREEKLELYASTAAYEPVEEFQDLEIDPSEDLDALEESLDEPDADTLAELSTETLMEEPTLTETPIGESAAADVSTLSDVTNLLGDIGTGTIGSDDAIGTGVGGGMVKFFGTEIKARRILYMLDNSGGMNSGGKFEALVAELLKSVAALDPKQKFSVVFYSDTVYPLFYPQSVFRFVPPSERNQMQLEKWLDTVELCYGNAIDEALMAAETIRPEAVFLLTDGDLFTTEKKKTLLLTSLGRRYSIHTFGLGVGEKTKTADKLRAVAEANGGTFRAIRISEQLAELAKEKQRVYNRDRPGLLWGLRVKAK
ncbi:MAG: hypothetical protein ACR2NM_12610 [Bythopirellula sp.]